eukprot:s444_g62.t1
MGMHQDIQKVQLWMKLELMQMLSLQALEELIWTVSYSEVRPTIMKILNQNKMNEGDGESESWASTDYASVQIANEYPETYENLDDEAYDDYRFELLGMASGVEHYVVKQLARLRRLPMRTQEDDDSWSATDHAEEEDAEEEVERSPPPVVTEEPGGSVPAGGSASSSPVPITTGAGGKGKNGGKGREIDDLKDLPVQDEADEA